LDFECEPFYFKSNQRVCDSECATMQKRNDDENNEIHEENQNDEVM